MAKDEAKKSALHGIGDKCFQLEKTAVYLSCCFLLFALVNGSYQKILESIQVFVKEFSSIVYKIGSNRRKNKDFMFLLHYVWATE